MNIRTFTSHYFTLDGSKMDGDRVKAISFEDAQKILDAIGKSWMKVDGILVAEVDSNLNGEPDWSTYVDYEIENLN
mgnify:CR=1 FL=1